MTGNYLLNIVRRHLKDLPTGTEQGEFWSNDEIRLVVNIAQDIVTNNALIMDNDKILEHLLRATEYEAAFAGVALPSTYLHYYSAQVQQGGRYMPASIYQGGEVPLYQNVEAGICLIWADTVHFKSGGSPADGWLYWYERPDAIVFNDDEMTSFTEEIYYDYIIPVAEYFLGMKEPQTQRELKLKMRALQEWATGTRYLTNFKTSEDQYDVNKSPYITNDSTRDNSSS